MRGPREEESWRLQQQGRARVMSFLWRWEYRKACRFHVKMSEWVSRWRCSAGFESTDEVRSLRRTQRKEMQRLSSRDIFQKQENGPSMSIPQISHGMRPKKILVRDLSAEDVYNLKRDLGGRSKCPLQRVTRWDRARTLFRYLIARRNYWCLKHIFKRYLLIQGTQQGNLWENFLWWRTEYQQVGNSRVDSFKMNLY